MSTNSRMDIQGNILNGTAEWNTAVKINEFKPHTTRWVTITKIKLNKTGQIEMNTH